jgi:hypothetical protein
VKITRLKEEHWALIALAFFALFVVLHKRYQLSSEQAVIIDNSLVEVSITAAAFA